LGVSEEASWLRFGDHGDFCAACDGFKEEGTLEYRNMKNTRLFRI